MQLDNGGRHDLPNAPAYPLEHIDRARLTQIIRHRVRNLCGGTRMILDVLRSRVPESMTQAFQWEALYSEVENMQRFSQRLDLLTEPLPYPRELPWISVLDNMRANFAARFPLCSLQIDGAENDFIMPAANWYGLMLDELLTNAGDAAGANGVVQVAWAQEPNLQIVIVNTGKRIPPEIPVDPPIPFRTTAPSRDGLGLAIVHRLCLALSLSMKVQTELTDATAIILQANHKE